MRHAPCVLVLKERGGGRWRVRPGVRAALRDELCNLATDAQRAPQRRRRAARLAPRRGSGGWSTARGASWRAATWRRGRPRRWRRRRSAAPPQTRARAAQGSARRQREPALERVEGARGKRAEAVRAAARVGKVGVLHAALHSSTTRSTAKLRNRTVFTSWSPAAPVALGVLPPRARSCSTTARHARPRLCRSSIMTALPRAVHCLTYLRTLAARAPPHRAAARRPPWRRAPPSWPARVRTPSTAVLTSRW